MTKWYLKVIVDEVYLTDIKANSEMNAYNKAYEYAELLDLISNVKSFIIYIKTQDIQYGETLYCYYEKEIGDEKFKFIKVKE